MEIANTKEADTEGKAGLHTGYLDSGRWDRGEEIDLVELAYALLDKIHFIILWFLVKEFISNWEDIKPYLSQLKIGWLVFAVIVYALCFMGTGFNWAYMQWQMDKSIHWVEYLNIHMTSAFARYIPGGIWNIVGKAYMCTSKGANKSAVTSSMILEYVFQIISSGFFLLFFLPVWFSALLFFPVGYLDWYLKKIYGVDQ